MDNKTIVEVFEYVQNECSTQVTCKDCIFYCVDNICVFDRVVSADFYATEMDIQPLKNHFKHNIDLDKSNEVVALVQAGMSYDNALRHVDVTYNLTEENLLANGYIDFDGEPLQCWECGSYNINALEGTCVNCDKALSKVEDGKHITLL